MQVSFLVLGLLGLLLPPLLPVFLGLILCSLLLLTLIIILVNHLPPLWVGSLPNPISVAVAVVLDVTPVPAEHIEDVPAILDYHDEEDQALHGNHAPDGRPGVHIRMQARQCLLCVLLSIFGNPEVCQVGPQIEEGGEGHQDHKRGAEDHLVLEGVPEEIERVTSVHY